jgi:hypothetical protein
MNRNLIFYILVTVIFGSLMWFVFDRGAALTARGDSAAVAEATQQTAGTHISDVAAGTQAGVVSVFMRSLFGNLNQSQSLL